MLPQTCNAAFWSSLLTAASWMSTTSVVGSARPLLCGLMMSTKWTLLPKPIHCASPRFLARHVHHSIDLICHFFGNLGTWPCLNRWVFVDRRRLGCKPHSADCVEMSCNGGIGFQTVVHGIGHRCLPWESLALGDEMI